MRSKQINYALYLVTDRNMIGRQDFRDIVRQAVEGGVTIVQLREKNCTARAFIEQARSLQAFLREKNIPLIINDRVDVALAVEADGVHLGQNDIPTETARKIIGDHMILGVSAESVSDAVRAEKESADYVSVSPVFSTPTKTDTAPALGYEGVKAIRQAVSVPLVAIGGIHENNCTRIIESGADGVAVVSAIMAADNPKTAAARLRAIIDSAKRCRNPV